MKHQLLQATVTFLRAIADALSGPSLASPEAAAAPEGPATPEPEAPAPRRGRPKKDAVATTDAVTPPSAEPVTEVKAQAVNEQPEPLTAEIIRNRWQDFIKVPGNSLKIKALFKPYDCEAFSNMDPKHYPAFNADVTALLAGFVKPEEGL